MRSPKKGFHFIQDTSHGTTACVYSGDLNNGNMNNKLLMIYFSDARYYSIIQVVAWILQSVTQPLPWKMDF